MIARQIASGGLLSAAGTNLALPSSGAGAIAQDTLAGSLLLLGVAAFGGTGQTINTPAGWTLIGVQQNRLTSVSIALFKQENAAVIPAGTAIAVTLGLSALAEIFFAEYPGMATSSAIDRITPATGSSTAIDTGATLGSSAPNEVAFGIASCANAPTAADLGANTSGFSLLVEQHSASKGTNSNTAAIYEKQLGAAGSSSELAVPITGGTSRAWCVESITLVPTTTPPVTTDDGKVHVWPSFQIGPALTGAAAPTYAPKIDAATGQIGLVGTSDKYGGQGLVLVTDNTALAHGPSGGALLVYLKSVQYQGSLSFPESWYAHSVKASDPTFGPGTRVFNANFPTVLIMQPDSTAAWTDTTGSIGPVNAVYNGFAAYRKQEALHAMTVWNAQYGGTSVAGGCWLDSAGNDSMQGQVDPVTGVAYTFNGSTPQWKPLVNALVLGVAQAMQGAGFICYANGLASNPDLVTAAGGCNGAMIENYVLNTTTPGAFPGGAPTDANMIADINSCLTAQIAGGGAQCLSTSNGNLSSAQKEVQRRFVVACYLLSQHTGKCYLQFNPDTSQGDWAISQGPSFAIALGSPLTTNGTAQGYRVVTGAGGGYLYQRNYSKGVVLLNSDPTHALSVTLTRSDLVDLDGNSVAAGSYTVQPKTASILQAAAAVPAPTNVNAPVQSGPGQSGGNTQTVTSDPIADWTGGPTLTYQWQSSPHGAGTWTDILEATLATYSPLQSDQTLDLRCNVTGTNAGGSLTVASNVVGPILPATPSNTALPVLSGGQLQGQAIATTDGTWNLDGVAGAASYGWQRATPGNLIWADIPGAAANSYTATAADVGFVIRSKVSETTTGGVGTAFSAPSGVIAAFPAPPSPVNPPLQLVTPTGWPAGWIAPVEVG